MTSLQSMGRWPLVGLLALLAGVSSGCGDDGAGELYRAERDFYRARRAATALRINEDVVSREEIVAVAEHYSAVGDKYFGALEGTTFEMASDARRLTARLGAHAYLASTPLFAEAGSPERGLERATRVRDAMDWSPDDARAAQVRVIELTQSMGNTDETVNELWRLVDEWPPVTAEGSAVHFAVLNAPMNAVRVREAARDRAGADLAVERALAYYRATRAEYSGKMPAFLADLHRATLHENRGDWEGGAEILASTLEAYSEPVVSAEERAQVAYRLGRMYAQPGRDVTRAEAFLAMAEEAAPTSDISFDARLFHAGLLSEQGRIDQALALYRQVQKGVPSDRVRAPLARFRLARLLQDAGRFDEALLEYRSLQSAFPTTPQALEVPLVLALHYRKAGEEELAQSILTEAESRYRDVIDREAGTQDAFMAYRFLFQCLAARENWTTAVDAMEAFADVYQGRPEAAEALMEAARISSQLLTDEPRSGRILLRIEEVYPGTRYAELAARLRAGG